MSNSNSKLGRLLSSVREYTSLFSAFESGVTPDQIKRGVIELLSPYFTDEPTLETLAVNALMGDAFELGRLSKDKLSFDLFEHAMDIHQQAKARNSSESLKVCAAWLPAVYEGVSVFWSQLHLELDKSTLELEEFTHECLRNMGSQ